MTDRRVAILVPMDVEVRPVVAALGAAVDMEASAVAAVAVRHGLRWTAVRGISDLVREGEVDESTLTLTRRDGTTDVGAALRRIARAPWRAPEMARMAAGTRRGDGSGHRSAHRPADRRVAARVVAGASGTAAASVAQHRVAVIGHDHQPAAVAVLLADLTLPVHDPTATPEPGRHEPRPILLDDEAAPRPGTGVDQAPPSSERARLQ